MRLLMMIPESAYHTADLKFRCNKLETNKLMKLAIWELWKQLTTAKETDVHDYNTSANGWRYRS